MTPAATRRTSSRRRPPRAASTARSSRTTAKAKRYIHFFAKGKADGDASMRDLLGGKGANLAEMTAIGLPVPPGFTISTEACQAFYTGGEHLPAGLMDQVRAAMTRLEKTTGKRFGDPQRPLLVSVRSGAAVSMPGMMDTVLNLGLNDEVVEGLAQLTNNRRFAYDAYRRLINMFGDVVMGVPHERFEEAFDTVKQRYGAKLDTDVPEEGLVELCQAYKRVYEGSVG
ncbi:MAG: pyruvate, phosphate dikinase, partial [Planctomycetota bacterium]